MLTCTFEDGGVTRLRHVVVASLVIKEPKILLVRRSPQSFTGANRWALPGGYLDPDESLEHAALRKIQEEAGYSAKIDRLFLINDRPDRKNDDRQNIEFVYLVQALRKLRKPDHEIAFIKWFPLYELPPAEAWAFDHFEVVDRYRQFLDKSVTLPIMHRFY